VTSAADAELGTVAVTGATGFIGSRLCHLLSSRGITTRAIVRGPASPRPGVEQVIAPLDGATRLARALAGVRTVVHLAGRAHVLRESAADPAAAFREVNVEGTRRLVEAAAAAGVARVILLSSIAAVATTARERVTDATPPAPDTAYGRSKLEAEAVVRATCEGDGLGYVILRAPMVFGPGMKGNPLRLFRLVDRGVPVPVGSARNERSTMYVDNLAAAVASTLDLPTETRETFVVGDSPPVSSADLVREIARALGRPVRLLPIPYVVMRGAGRVGDALARVVPFSLTSDAVERLFGSLAVDHSRFARATGYVPPQSRSEAMLLTAAWYRRTR
jgi:nucleoside-diphosphate-sugar epimerase